MQWQLIIFKWAIPGLFWLIFGLFQININTIFTTNQSEKMSMQYTGLGFEPTTLRLQVSSHNY